jgi:teichuronic acid biosynthesis glycosyltransferase TuaG
MVFFSVVIPCFNSERYIRETLESVLIQKFADFEILVVDDASTDRTVSIVEAYASQDSRVRVISLGKSSGGPATPRNVGIEQSNGKYIAFLDADDIWDEEKLFRDAEFLDSHPVEILFSGAYYFQETPKQVTYVCHARPVGWSYLFRNHILLQTICIDRDIIKNDILRFDPDPLLVGIEDYHFLLSAYLCMREMVFRTGINVYYRKNAPTSIYRSNDFGLVMRRLVYNLSKIAAKQSMSLPVFLSALAISISTFYLKRLRGTI